MSADLIIATALLFGCGVLLSYVYYRSEIAEEWALWRPQMSTLSRCAWVLNAGVCVLSYWVMVVYAAVHDSTRIATVLALFSASACTWAPTLGKGNCLVGCSVLSTGVLSLGFMLVYFEVPDSPVYWAAPAVLVLQHVGFDLGWWVEDYCVRPKPCVLLLVD